MNTTLKTFLTLALIAIVAFGVAYYFGSLDCDDTTYGEVKLRSTDIELISNSNNLNKDIPSVETTHRDKINTIDNYSTAKLNVANSYSVYPSSERNIVSSGSNISAVSLSFTPIGRTSNGSADLVAENFTAQQIPSISDGALFADNDPITRAIPEKPGNPGNDTDVPVGSSLILLLFVVGYLSIKKIC